MSENKQECVGGLQIGLNESSLILLYPDGESFKGIHFVWAMTGNKRDFDPIFDDFMQILQSYKITKLSCDKYSSYHFVKELPVRVVWADPSQVKCELLEGKRVYRQYVLKDKFPNINATMNQCVTDEKALLRALMVV